MNTLQNEVKTKKSTTIWWTIGTIVVGIIAIWVYFRYERDVSSFIRHLGPFGVTGSIILMALLCVIPFPAEFLMIIDMQIYGVWLGILYVWLGAMLGSYVTFLLAKHFGEGWIRKFVAEKHLQKLNELVERHGAIGLFMARLIPLIPFVVLNYAAAMLPEVGTWTYLWTTGLGIMPYDLGAALVFLGFSKRTLGWLITGGVALVLIWIGALFLRHKSKKEETNQTQRLSASHPAPKMRSLRRKTHI